MILYVIRTHNNYTTTNLSTHVLLHNLIVHLQIYLTLVITYCFVGVKEYEIVRNYGYGVVQRDSRTDGQTLR